MDNDRLGCRLPVRAVIALLWGLAAVVSGLAMFEVSMQPTWQERIELGAIFLIMVAAMWVAARWLPQLARRNRSIKGTVVALSTTAFSIVVAGALAVGNRMFFSSHDLTLLLVVIAFGVVAAFGFAVSVSRPLTSDLDQLADSADKVAQGDLASAVRVERHDEVGRLSEALERMVAQLEQAEEERSADAMARQEFFAAVGHDLRTPLASIQAAVEAVSDDIVDDPGIYLQTIQADVAALAGLVEDLYLLARLDSGEGVVEAGEFDVTEVADESIEVLAPLAAQRGVALDLCGSERRLAFGSAEAVGRVLRNLLDNAVRHSPVSGKVTVAVERVGESVLIVVSDEGSGFSASLREVAFERFSREETARSRDGGGSGLGLSIARSLVERMGGEIWIGDGPGGEVGFSLPLATPGLRDPEAPRRRTSSPLPA